MTPYYFYNDKVTVSWSFGTLSMQSLNASEIKTSQITTLKIKNEK